MWRLLSAMSLVLATWAALAIVLLGLGLFIRRGFGLRTLTARTCLASYWIGWCWTLFFLQLWHCFLPVDWHALAVLSMLGCTGIALHAARLRQWLTRPHHGTLLFGVGWASCCAVK